MTSGVTVRPPKPEDTPALVALLQQLGAWARALGANRIVDTSGLARTDAHAFYERIGYEHTARRFSRSL
jgi:hypothetical protein